MAAGLRVQRIDDIPARDEDGREWLPLRDALGVRAFGLNAFRAARPGVEVVEPHDEADAEGGGHQEVYVVVRGGVRFAVGGEAIEAPAGTAVFVEDPSLHRTGVATTPDTLVLAIGAEPGRAFEPSGWELRALGR